MSKSIQGYVLYNMLKAAGDKGVTKEQVAQALSVKENSVPVYFFSLKKHYNIQVETIKQGRQVVAYKLASGGEDIQIPQHRKGAKATKKAVVKKVVSNTISDDGEVPTLQNHDHISDREFADIKSQLGLD